MEGEEQMTCSSGAVGARKGGRELTASVPTMVRPFNTWLQRPLRSLCAQRQVSSLVPGAVPFVEGG